MSGVNLHDLPESWTWTSLENCVDVLDSQRIPINAKERETRKGEIPYYGATGQVGWIDDYIFDEELVLLGEDGAPFLDPIKNKSYIIKGKNWVNNHAHVLRALNGISLNQFISYYLNIFNYNGYVTGTTRLKLNQAPMRKIPVPLAPLIEQHRIVARIEALFSRLDAGVEAIRRARAQLQRYRQSVLQAAVEGRLTAEWRAAHPEVEPAEELLDRIIKKRRRPPERIESSDLPNLPGGWIWASTDQLASNNKYSMAIGPFGSNLKVVDYRSEGVPLIFVRNIRSGVFNGQRTCFVSNEKAEELRAHFVESGDILITKMGDPPGDACIYPESMPPAIITADCIKWRLSPLLKERTYFSNAINSILVKKQILRSTKGVAQQKISLIRFKKIGIPLPPPREQNEIAKCIESCFSFADQTEREFDRSILVSTSLRQSILRRAFQGKLVPQDPSDEPASLLLERIRAQRIKEPQRRGRMSKIHQSRLVQ